MKNHIKTPENDAVELLTLPEAARLLFVSRQHLYQMCQAGRMPHCRIGNSIRLHRAVIDGLLDAGRPRIAPAKTLTA